MGALTIETVRDADTYHRRRDHTLELFTRCGSPWSAVAHPDWVEAWWRSRPSHRLMECALVWDGDRLVAAFPFEYVERFHLPVRKASSTNLAWGWSSALVDEHATRGCGEALLSWLAHDARRWSVLEFGLFPPESELTQRLSGLVDGSGWHRAEISRDVASLPLPGTYEDWYSSRSKHLRRKIRRTQAKATQHDVSVRTFHEVTPELLAEVVGAVSQRSWQGTEGLAVYNEEANRTFYNLLCTVAQDLRLVLHSVTNSAGTPLAYVVAVRTAVVVHHVDTGFDPAAADLSPGLLATVEGVRWACEQGVTEIDLGIYAEYKERFGPRVVEGSGIQITRGLGGLIARARTTT